MTNQEGSNLTMRRRLRIIMRRRLRMNTSIGARKRLSSMTRRYSNVRENLKIAKGIWGYLPKAARRELEELTRQYCLCVALGDVQRIQGRWYVTSAGLLRLAIRRGCRGIAVSRLPSLCDPGAGRWVFKSTVYTSARSRGFVGHGDANPLNVSPLVRGAEM
jgi:hypothetical protein